MAIVTTYAEWSILLDQFGTGDDSVLEKLNTGTFIIDAGTSNRFYLKVEEVYKKRKQSWLNKFQFSFQFENFKTIDDFAIALRNGKQNLLILNKFISLEGLPDDLKKTLKKDLEGFIVEIKTTLKQNTSKVSKEKEKMIFLLNSFELNISSQEIKTDTLNNNFKTNQIIPSSGREIIF